MSHLPLHHSHLQSGFPSDLTYRNIKRENTANPSIRVQKRDNTELNQQQPKKKLKAIPGIDWHW